MSHYSRPQLSTIHVFDKGVEVMDFQYWCNTPSDYKKLQLFIMKRFSRPGITCLRLKQLVIFEAIPDLEAIYRLYLGFGDPDYDFQHELIR